MKLRADVEVFVAVRPIDLRWSFDRLAGVVSEQIGRNPKAGALFVFFGRRSDGASPLPTAAPVPCADANPRIRRQKMKPNKQLPAQQDQAAGYDAAGLRPERPCKR